MTLLCICGKTLKNKNKRDITRKKYCSNECRYAGVAISMTGRKRAPIGLERACIECKNSFLATTKKNIYCSKRCQLKVAGYKSWLKKRSNPELYFELLEKRKNLPRGTVNKLLKQQNGLCAISGMEMTNIHGKGYVNTNISIDRITSSRGYVCDNIQLTCFIVNLMKRDMEIEELLFWCNKIKEKNHSFKITQPA